MQVLISFFSLVLQVFISLGNAIKTWTKALRNDLKNKQSAMVKEIYVAHSTLWGRSPFTPVLSAFKPLWLHAISCYSTS